MSDVYDADFLRVGGLVGSGANGHRRALKEYRELKDGK